MFRVSQFIDELFDPTPIGPRRDPPGPVVIWNLIRQCNLLCKHCYTISADKKFPGELSTQEVFKVMDDLKAFKVPALILSGGEPLLRPDIFELSKRSVDMGFSSFNLNQTGLNYLKVFSRLFVRRLFGKEVVLQPSKNPKPDTP